MSMRDNLRRVLPVGSGVYVLITGRYKDGRLARILSVDENKISVMSTLDVGTVIGLVMEWVPEGGRWRIPDSVENFRKLIQDLGVFVWGRKDAFVGGLVGMD